MPNPYRYYLSQEVDDVLATTSRRNGRVLRDFFRFLAANPFTRGEQQVPDNDGRLCEVKAHDRFVVTYRPEHAVKHMLIVAIEFG